MKKSCRNVRWKDSVVGFENNGLKNIYNIQKDIYLDKYKIQKYQYFTIYEPKKRDIIATRIRDRTFQRSLCDNGLTKDIVEHFIIDNPACQKDKGNSFVYKRMKKHLHNYYLNYGSDG
ncbi:MAG: hypothetical protein KBT03_03295 [Bacteroidales bacterium]|nr:hypothetical protein [Candidatus Scybalousia scybalohippi]